MKWVLIGHRGVGKTQLLRRLEAYYENGPRTAFIDLDQEIEFKFKKPIFELFPEVGEAQFRIIEKEIFDSALEKNPSFIISVGAGFSPDWLAEQQNTHKMNILWLRRKTDILGRVFLNRPRLDSGISALKEFHQRFASRQKAYQENATEVYWVPEGLRDQNDLEEKICSDARLETQGILTLLPWHLKDFHFMRYNCDFYEWRDDLLASHSTLWERIPFHKRLLSFRNKMMIQESLKGLKNFALSDWGLELGPCPSSDIKMLSAHKINAGETLSDFLLRLERSAVKAQHLKASPVVENYSQVVELLKWQEQDPSQRSILPRAPDALVGRWLWLRLYMKGRQKINFWRDSDGSSEEQPTLFEWMSSSNKPEHFAALLGDPVFHSRTMLEQSEFFENLKAPIWPILLDEYEFWPALQILRKMGLIAAAVTSPLKKVAFANADSRSEESNQLNSVNTLFLSAEKIFGHNTDLFGFEKLIEKAGVNRNDAIVAVWGGGGTLNVIKKILPQAIEISVRTRKPRDSKITLPHKVDVLIWAAGPRDEAPSDINFDILIDLNYREDSRARELAISLQKKYVSGDDMFLAQASAQREFWAKLTKS
jgi:shikimate 5-dehydrogenase/shikimate kinase